MPFANVLCSFHLIFLEFLILNLNPPNHLLAILHPHRRDDGVGHADVHLDLGAPEKEEEQDSSEIVISFLHSLWCIRDGL